MSAAVYSWHWLMISDPLQRLRDACALALLPPPHLLVSEWARQQFRLSSEYSAAVGHFEPYPYQIEPLDILSPSNPADMMCLMCGAQMMKTLIMMVFLGYVIDVNPGPVLIVQPSQEDANAFSKERLAPMVADVPAIAGKVVEAKSRDSGNTILQKRFRGGSVSLTGAVSPRGLRRRSVRYLLMDEIDGYQETSDGDPIALAAARTSKFWNRKIVLCSTPTIQGRSRIVAVFEDSDQRFFFVPCPFCQYMQRLVWDNVRWGYVEQRDGKPDLDGRYIPPEDAHYECASCAELIPHHRKLEMLHAGEWRATNPAGKYPGFAISRLYAPDWSWGKVVTDPVEGWLSVKDDPAKHMVFKNNVLAEVWREPGDAPPDYEVLMSRHEEYRLGQVPERVLFLTSGVDVQKTWIEGYVWGWGRNRERWVIDAFRIEKNPFDTSAWDDLEVQLRRTYRHPSRADLAILRMCVDSGYAGNEVYIFARRHPARVLAVDGRPSGRVLVDAPSQVDVTIAGRRIKHGAKLWPVNVSMAKQELYAALNRPRPAENEPYPPGWIHFPVDLPEEFYRQLTAEEFRLSVGRGGQRKYSWEPIQGRRSEALDCANYARAGSYNCGIDKFEEQHWRNLEALLKITPPPQVTPAAGAPSPAPTPQPAAPRPQPRRIIRSAYLNNRGY